MQECRNSSVLAMEKYILIKQIFCIAFELKIINQTKVWYYFRFNADQWRNAYSIIIWI